MYTTYHDLLWYANGLSIFGSNMLEMVDWAKVQMRTDWDLMTSTARRILCQQKSSHWFFSQLSWIGPFHTYIGNQLFLDWRTFTARLPKQQVPPRRSRWFLPCPLPSPMFLRTTLGRLVSPGACETLRGFHQDAGHGSYLFHEIIPSGWWTKYSNISMGWIRG